MNIFLRLKHWQLFGLLIGIPVIFLTVGMKIAISFEEMATVFMLTIILFFGVFYGWLYTLGVNLNKRLPGTVKMGLIKFKWFLFISVAFIIYSHIFVYWFLEHIDLNPVIHTVISSDIMLLPQFFSVFCFFYGLYFNAKSLKAVLLQRPVTFSDYSEDFFFFWFFPIGVWIIQPRINEIFDDTLQ